MPTDADRYRADRFYCGRCGRDLGPRTLIVTGTDISVGGGDLERTETGAWLVGAGGSGVRVANRGVLVHECGRADDVQTPYGLVVQKWTLHRMSGFVTNCGVALPFDMELPSV